MDGASKDVEENHSLLGDPEPFSARRWRRSVILAKIHAMHVEARYAPPPALPFRFLVALTASVMCFGPQIAHDSIGAAGPYLRKSCIYTLNRLETWYSAAPLP